MLPATRVCAHTLIHTFIQTYIHGVRLREIRGMLEKGSLRNSKRESKEEKKRRMKKNIV